MISSTDKQKLRALFAKRSRAEQKALFALIRAHNDKALLAALAPAKPKRKADTLAREVDGALRPLLASSAEKAELLVEHLARKRRKALAIVPKGVADAVRKLRAAGLTDTQIRAGAKGLIAELARSYSTRETVV